MDTLLEYCKALYNLKGCGAGGLLHILLDDDNYRDGDILYCLEECMKHPEREESALGALICKEYAKMTMEERSVFDWYWNGSDLECPSYNGQCCPRCKFIYEED
jgi:hypothetical protein